MLQRMRKEIRYAILLFAMIALSAAGLLFYRVFAPEPVSRGNNAEEVRFELSDVPEYAGEPYVILNEGKPFFHTDRTEEYTEFSELDDLGRCGPAEALIGKDMLAEGTRGSLGNIQPAGWHTVRYDDLITDKYLYNRCHLIAYELCGINAEERMLVTGTRYMNIAGMLPFENRIREHISSTGHPTAVRSTPVYEGNELLCRGILLEAYDPSDSFSLCVFCYNVQPGIIIDYDTGESRRETEIVRNTVPEKREYILNTRSMKFHLPECEGVSAMAEHNKEIITADRQELIDMGYSPCGTCNP